MEYLPGWEEYDTYGQLTVQFDMDEVEAVDWTDAKIKLVLQSMADEIEANKPVEAIAPAFGDEINDGYGHMLSYKRFPALVPLIGMQDKEYPADLTSSKPSWV